MKTSVKSKEEKVDPWSLYLYAMKAPMTRDRYQTRLAKFFDFISLEIGAKLEDSVRRSEAFETAIEKAGGKSIGLYYTLGKHDMVAVVHTPNDEAIASVLYSAGSLGNVRTETLRAFSTSEAAKVIEKS